MISAERQPLQSRDIKTQKMRSPGFTRGRLTERRRTASCWRSARFSATRMALLLARIENKSRRIFNTVSALFPGGGKAILRGRAKMWQQAVSGADTGRPRFSVGTGGDISPDGARILYEGFVQDGALLRREVLVIPAGAGEPERRFPFPDGDQPRLAPAGDAFTYTLEKDGVDNIWSQPLAGGPPRQISHFPSLRVFAYDRTPDGKQIVLARGRTISDAVILTGFR